MIFIAVNIFFLLLVFTGVGLLFPWLAFREERRFEALLVTFWVGWSVSIACLQVWHFFFPVGLAAFGLVLSASLLGWRRKRTLMAAVLRDWNRPAGWLLAGLGLLPCFMLANHVLFNPPNSDYALYHLQTVKWYASYAIVPGLGNLFNPLAFNSASFLYTAMIDSGWLAGRAYFVSNTLLAYVAVLHSAAGWVALTQRRPIRSADLFNALMLPVIVMQVSTAYIVAYSPDPVMFFLQVMIISELLHLLEDTLDERRFQNRSMQLVLFVVVGICVKLSFAVFGAMCLAVMAWLYLRRYPPKLRQWAAWAGLGSSLLLPWMARSVVMSGYLAFPNTTIGFPVDWKIPAQLADAAQVVIKLWAVTVNGSIEYTADMAWFGNWWRTFPFFARQTFVFSVGLLLLALAGWIFLRTRRGAALLESRPNLSAASLLLICAPALVFWFVMGPSYRFSGALLWILLAAGLLLNFHLLTATRLIPRPDLLAYGLVLVVALWLSPNHFSNNLSRSLLFLPPTEAALAEQALPSARLRQQTTNSGLVIHLPPEGVEECWNAPLPCTTAANFLPGLRLRQANNLQKGFVLEFDD